MSKLASVIATIIAALLVFVMVYLATHLPQDVTGTVVQKYIENTSGGIWGGSIDYMLLVEISPGISESCEVTYAEWFYVEIGDIFTVSREGFRSICYFLICILGAIAIILQYGAVSIWNDWD